MVVASAGPYASLHCAPYSASTPPLSFYGPDALPIGCPKTAIHITHHLTHGMPYSSMLLQIYLDSLATRREDLSRRFFRDIMDPASCLHSLLPPPRSTAITSKLRCSQILPKVHTRTKRYCSFIQYDLNHYE